MASALVEWLAGFGATAFRWSVILFVAVNAVAIAMVVLTRDRALVNRWTGRILAANLLLVGTGVVVPVVTAATRLAIAAFVPGVQQLRPVLQRSDTESALTQPK